MHEIFISYAKEDKQIAHAIAEALKKEKILPFESLVQYFQPEHAYQPETIPGIKDMIAKYK